MTVSTGSCAILAIDLQNEYRLGAAYPVEEYDLVLAKAAGVMAAARASGIPVIHVQAWVEEDEKEKYALLNDGLTKDKESAVAGSDGAELCVETGPVEGETVVRKRWPSAFMDTDLAERLKARQIAELIVVGVWTDSCVRASVFDAIYQGFRVHLVKDACGSGTRTMHRTAILDMANRLYGGTIMTSAAAIEALTGNLHASWHCLYPVSVPYTVETIDALYEAL